MTIRGSRLRALAATSLIAVACSSAPGDVGPVAQVGGPVATAPATPPADPVEVAAAIERTEPTPQDWTAPDPITVEYVTRVLTEIERLQANFDRWLIDSEPWDEPPADIEADFLGIYHLLIGRNLMQEVLVDYAEDEDGRPDAARPLGQDYPTDIELLLTRPDCILARVDWDTSGTVLPTGVARAREIIGLVDTPASQVHTNQTGWVIAFNFRESEVDPNQLQTEIDGEGSLCDN